MFDRLLRSRFSQNFGEVPEWPKGTDCKSVGSAFGGSNPPLPILNLGLDELAGIAQLARASAFQAEGRGFESRFPLHLFGVEVDELFFRPRSSVVEHFLGKEEVIGSIPIVGSRFFFGA